MIDTFIVINKIDYRPPICIYMYIFVELYSKQLMIDVEPSDTILDLKWKICVYTDYEYECPCGIRLVYNNIEPRDDRCLSYYNIRKESVVRISIKSGGGSMNISDIMLRSGNTYVDSTCNCRSTTYVLTNAIVDLVDEPISVITANNRNYKTVKDTLDTNELCHSNNGVMYFHPIDIKYVKYIKILSDLACDGGYVGSDNIYRPMSPLTEEDIQVIYKYTTSDYKEVKIPMQIVIWPPSDEKKQIGLMTDDQCVFAKRLQDAIYSCPKDPSGPPRKVYHIATMDDETYYKYDIGLLYIEPTFISTSDKKLNWQGNTMFVITMSPRGMKHCADICKYSKYPEQHEHLLPAGGVFKVNKKKSCYSGVYAHKIYVTYYGVVPFFCYTDETDVERYITMYDFYQSSV